MKSEKHHNLNKHHRQSDISGFLAIEKLQLDNILPHYPGFHLVIVGKFFELKALERSFIQHKVQLHDYVESSRLTSKVDLVSGNYAEMPFLSDSIDVVILPHILEFAKEPQQILKEIWRILIPEGYAIILDFNPYSFLAIRKFLAKHSLKNFPNKFYSMFKLRKQLLNLGFKIEDFKTFHFRPFLSLESKGFQYTAFMDIIGQFFWPSFGDVYLYVVKKSVVGLTPIRPLWRKEKLLVKGGVTEPTRLEDIT